MRISSGYLINAITRSAYASAGPLSTRSHQLPSGNFKMVGSRLLGPPDTSRHPRAHGRGGTFRLELGGCRRRSLARLVGCGDRGAAQPHRIPPVAGHRPAAAHMGPPAGREHAGAPACDRCRGKPAWPGSDAGAGACVLRRSKCALTMRSGHRVGLLITKSARSSADYSLS